MAESLRLAMIVGGVETEAQRDYLESRGKILSMQGWYFSTPMNSDALQLLSGERMERRPCLKTK